ncbi:hypothetical protein B0H14DRAFT_308987 [Mycena olivaceomarginata]|nr:hypothetical protein B0H14DRAFT_308987 [Mycena olivaceomarginata]
MKGKCVGQSRIIWNASTGSADPRATCLPPTPSYGFARARPSTIRPVPVLRTTGLSATVLESRIARPPQPRRLGFRIVSASPLSSAAVPAAFASGASSPPCSPALPTHPPLGFSVAARARRRPRARILEASRRSSSTPDGGAVPCPPRPAHIGDTQAVQLLSFLPTSPSSACFASSNDKPMEQSSRRVLRSSSCPARAVLRSRALLPLSFPLQSMPRRRASFYFARQQQWAGTEEVENLAHLPLDVCATRPALPAVYRGGARGRHPVECAPNSGSCMRCFPGYSSEISTLTCCADRAMF